MHSGADSARSFSSDQLMLLNIVKILRSRLRLITAVVATAFISSIGLAYFLTRVYDATVVIVEVSDSQARTNSAGLLGQLGGLGNIMGIDLGTVGATQTSGMTVLQSRTILEEFIQRNDLMTTVLSDYWDEATGDWDPTLGREPSLWEGAERFRQSVILEADQEYPELVNLTVSWPDPVLAAKWANELVSLANELTRKTDIAEAERSILYLNSQIEQTQVVQLQQALYNLLQSELERLMLANAREEYAFEIVDPAVIPVEAARPRRLEIIAIGTFFGLILALFLVFLLRVRDDLREQELLQEPDSQQESGQETA